MKAVFIKKDKELEELPLDHKGRKIIFWGGSPSIRIKVSDFLYFKDGQEYEEGKDFKIIISDKRIAVPLNFRE